MRSLIKDHPFRDGNKRVALTATDMFLLLNGHAFGASQEERVQFALQVAASEPDISIEEVSKWIEEHSIPLDTFMQRAEELKLFDRVPGLRQAVEEVAEFITSRFASESKEAD